MLITDLDNCCGCTACLEICKHGAITMVRNSEGFLYPHINNQLCTECGLCNKICPINNYDNIKYTSIRDCYAAINRNKNILVKSSSGGIFSVIAEYILSKKGVVCGASFDTDFSVKHILIENKSDIYKLRGSKYLESEIVGLFPVIKNMLQQNRLVYFTGTSCQVAGLKSYLRKDYDNLYTSDIVCHGVPSFYAFKNFIKYYELKSGNQILSYSFRDKKYKGWSCTSSAIVQSKKKIKYLPYHPIFDSYFNAFISGSINRESCYNCKFTTHKRCGDITLSDYWGVENYHKINSDDGVSFVIVNSTRGRELISKLSGEIILEKTRIEWAEVINRNLVECTKRPEERDSAYIELIQDPEKFIIKYIPKDYLLRYVKTYVKGLLRFFNNIFVD